jgi:hypothetical protein
VCSCTVVSPIDHFPSFFPFSFWNARSGTVLDLPYRFSADDTKMRLESAFNMKKMMGKLAQPEALACCACLLFLLLSGGD